MATVLLVGAGLFVRTVVGMLNVPLGFETDRLLTARDRAAPGRTTPARATYLDPARRVVFYRETLRRIAALPGVERAAMSSQIPMGGFNAPLFVEIDGPRHGRRRARPVMHDFQVSPGYFETMGVRILQRAAVRRIRSGRRRARRDRQRNGRADVLEGARSDRRAPAFRLRSCPG